MKVIIDGVEYVPRITASANPLPPARKLFEQARKHSGLTLREVADAIGVSYNTVYCAECYDNVPPKTAMLLSQFYGIDFNSLAKCMINDWKNERKIR